MCLDLPFLEIRNRLYSLSWTLKVFSLSYMKLIPYMKLFPYFSFSIARAYSRTDSNDAEGLECNRKCTLASFLKIMYTHKIYNFKFR